jgi:protein-tyrosine phosphatase
VVDLHSHILPGIDDGARSLEESLAIARTAVSQGIKTIAATPHVRADYPTRPDEMEHEVAVLRRALEASGVAIDLIHGAEIAIDMLPTLGPDTLNRFTLGQSGRYLLIEFPYFGWPTALEGAIDTLRRLGIMPVLAHPERNPRIQQNPSILVAATELGGLVQVTAASVAGDLGRDAYRAVNALLELRAVHLIASDVHRPGSRESGLARAAELVGGGPLGRYLTEEAPASVALGLPVGSPPRLH